MRILRPIIVGALAITFLFLAMAQWILPKTIAATNHIWHEELQGKVPLGIYREGRYYYRGKEGFYSFEWPDTATFSFHNFSYSRWNKDYKLSSLLSAAECDYGPHGWIFHHGQIQTLQKDGRYTYKSFDNMPALLPESPDQFFVPEYRSDELSLIELFQEAQAKDTAEEQAKGWALFYGKISYIFLGLPLLLLGLPVLVISFQKWGRDLAIAIPASCVLAFTAWGIWGALQSLAKAGYVSPILAAAIIHLLFCTSGLVLLHRQDQ